MRKSARVIALSSYVALACSGMLMSTSCGTPSDHVESSPVTLEIRFQDDTAATQPPSTGLRRFAVAAPGPTTHDTVARILVDITFADSGLPFSTNVELNKVAPDVWNGTVPLLPRNQPLRFVAGALDASGAVGFSGETLATLTIGNQDVQIPLAPAEDNHIFQMPRMVRIAYPDAMFSGQEDQVAFTIEGNASAAIDILITPLGSPTTPSADFSPATGRVTLTNTVADFMTVYTPPEVTVDTDFNYQVAITDARAQTAVTITTNFSTHVKPRAVEDFNTATLSVRFNPVILSLTANGSETPSTVELVANVRDDSAPDRLTFQWSYTPNPGTPGARFASNGLGNPGLFQGYTVAHEGTITLAVTDENHGTTTLHYTLAPGQFGDVIEHTSLKRIVSGRAHTCVLVDESRVRCWGDNQFGQLGYGNAIDVGDAPSRLPFTAGDVPLPVSDPVQQLVAGNNHTCVLLQSGLVYCWGDNQFGQLGYNRTDNLGDDEAVTSFGVVTLGALATRIAAGGDHTCAILLSGALRCWGRNDFGQLGRGNTQNIGGNEPVYSVGNVDLGAGVTVKDLALGGFHTCALLTTGAVRCWGRNDVGQLGYGDIANLGDNEPINNIPNVSLTGTVRKLVAGNLHTCALTFAGTLRCWGYGGEGQLGQSFGGSDLAWGDAANELPSTLPGDINTGAQVTDVAAGGFHTCALSSDGQLTCWGLGNSGQLGYGTFNNLGTPQAAGVDLEGATAYRVAAGAAHTCALRSNGTARCWGSGADGRLGRGSTATSATATGNVDIQIFAPRHTVGGTVSGLAGSGLVLRNNGGDDLLVSANGTFTFPTDLPDLSAYVVTVRTQPTNRSQTCTVSDGSGNLAGANVTNVAITCVTNSYTVGGSVSGLAGSGLVLRNAGEVLAVSASGTFTFATKLESGANYDVTVQTQPNNPRQTCVLMGGSGTVVSGNITSVAVNCTTDRFLIGGTVSGLAGSGLVLRNNGGDNLTIGANGTFALATSLADLSAYVVTVQTQPTGPSQTCAVSNGSGNLAGANVTNVTITCVTNRYTVGGSVSGLAGSGLVLRNNNGDNLAINANGTFAFATSLTDLSAYSVTVQMQPTNPSQTCTLSSGSGNIAGANVTNVAVSCVVNTFSVGGSVSGLGTGQSVVLQNNGANSLTVSTNSGFTFTTPVASNSPYAVTVLTNPPGRACTVMNGSGAVAASNITNVAVTCKSTSCALPWGGAINDGQSVTAFQASSAGCTGSCVSQIRTCSLGVLSGSFTNQSCSPPGAPTPCGTNCLRYSCPGTNSFTVPAGVNSLVATVVAAGGGGGGAGTRMACTCTTSACTFQPASGGGGGAGGSVTIRASVTPGATLTVKVGAPGFGGADLGQGGAGGPSAISGVAISASAFGGGGATIQGGSRGTTLVSAGNTLENIESTVGNFGLTRSARCDGSSGAFFLSGGAGGHINSSFIAGFGGGGKGGDVDQNGGIVAAAGQPGVVQISW